MRLRAAQKLLLPLTGRRMSRRMSALAVRPTVQIQSHRGMHAVVSSFAAAAWQSVGHAATGLTSQSSMSGAKAVSSRQARLVLFC